ncbi:MAG: lytic murein transglycosylase [Thioalkalivibrio sp.]|nr:MAG: lytic murein transglycosylase [Thioalkalivibrio sp.]
MKKPVLAATLTIALLPALAFAAPDFDDCLDGIRDQAVADGVKPEVADRVLAQVEFLDRVIELDRRQPEFTTPFADYLARSVTQRRVERGRELLQTHRPLLERVQRETGVPPAYLLAFWGLETSYGSYFGGTSVPSALATLACDPRRSEFFTGELIAALRIVQEDAIPLERMQGSWAGAMGHVQFMPSVFLRHAVDADGDGRRDLWNSVPDAMLSAGSFLQDLGWDTGYRWGREVLLPEDFDFAAAGQSLRRPLADWRHLGVTDVSGRPVAELELPAQLLLPAGHRGPTFLVYSNFNVILGWNRSEHYALAVGHLADRIAGAGPLHTPPPSDAPRLSSEEVMRLQATLNDRGFDSGTVDGILGPATRHAIRAYQLSEGMIPDGFPGHTLLARLDIR